MAPIVPFLLSTLLFGLSSASSARPNVFSMPMRHGRPRSTPVDLDKRDPFNSTVQNLLPAETYFITIGVGTPPQVVELSLSTGSSDILVFGVGTCQPRVNSPCYGGAYDPGKSSTSKSLTARLGKFKITYSGGSGARGYYWDDDLTIGGKTVTDMTLVEVYFYHGFFREGILGIGLNSKEAIVSLNKAPYPNLPDLLVSQGLIKSKAYSMYLDDLEQSTGNVLFGGYDTAKFYKSISMLPLQPDPFSSTDSIDTFIVSLSLFAISYGGGSRIIDSDRDPYPLPVLIEAGTTFTYLPYEFFEPFIKPFNLRQFASGESNIFTPWIVDCDQAKILGSGAILFKFGSTNAGPFIKVAFEEMIYPRYNPNTGEQYTHDGKLACSFGIVPASAGQIPTLGQTFLRSTYALFDLENKAVGFAQAKFGVKSSNVLEYKTVGSMLSITTDRKETAPATIPFTAASYTKHFKTTPKIVTDSTIFFSASYPVGVQIPTAVPSAVTTGFGAQQTSSTTRPGPRPGPTHTKSPPPTPPGNSHLGVEVGVPVAVVGALILAGVGYWLWRRGRKKDDTGSGNVESQTGTYQAPPPNQYPIGSWGQSPTTEQKSPLPTYTTYAEAGRSQTHADAKTEPEMAMSSQAGPVPEMFAPIELDSGETTHEMQGESTWRDSNAEQMVGSPISHASDPLSELDARSPMNP